MATAGLNLNKSAEPLAFGPKLVAVDQTLVVFDVEQCGNASQLITLFLLPGPKAVAWRIQTNAPTRYMVCPNGGVLSNQQPIKIVIECVGNRYNPLHEMILQAVSLGKEDPQQIWNKEEELSESGQIQTITFELGTTLMYVDRTMNLDETSPTQQTLAQIIDNSQTVGADRVKELSDLLSMITYDNDTLMKNISQTEHLKEVLVKQITSKNQVAAETAKRLVALEQDIARAEQEIQQLEAEAKKEKEKAGQPTPCAIM